MRSQRHSVGERWTPGYHSLCDCTRAPPSTAMDIKPSIPAVPCTHQLVGRLWQMTIAGRFLSTWPSIKARSLRGQGQEGKGRRASGSGKARALPVNSGEQTGWPSDPALSQHRGWAGGPQSFLAVHNTKQRTWHHLRPCPCEQPPSPCPCIAHVDSTGPGCRTTAESSS